MKLISCKYAPFNLDIVLTYKISSKKTRDGRGMVEGWSRDGRGMVAQSGKEQNKKTRTQKRTRLELNCIYCKQ
jgi:acyl-CoA thioesterase